MTLNGNDGPPVWIGALVIAVCITASLFLIWAAFR